METTTELRNDASIRETVLSELKWDPKIESDEIAVAVKDGIVTLSGFVNSYWQLEAAEDTVKRVHGVRAVANNLEVKMFWQRTDAEIARSAVEALDRHVGLPEDIKVSVKNGQVTLEGTVEFEFQRKLAQSSVKKLRGVARVTNKIQVKPPVSPREVEKKIEEALRRSAEIDARRIQVEVKDSEVKLYGSVRSWAEKEEAEGAAWSAPGTTKVESFIVVNP